MKKINIFIVLFFILHVIEAQVPNNDESNLPTEGNISEINWGNYLLGNNTSERTVRIGVSNDGYTRSEIELENNNSPSGKIIFKTANQNGGTIPRMSILGNGNIGVGIDVPEEKMHIIGNALISDLGICNDYNVNIERPWIIYKNETNTRSLGFLLTNDAQTKAEIKLWEGNTHNPYISFSTSPGAGQDMVERMRIKKDGNIGIGVINPTEKLVVDGTVVAEEVKVQNVPQSDYVFEPDYPLLPLSEVEAFITENKHLPNFPSALQFKENGVGLGEMDDMLLRKVEELTLYMIELKKENEDLKKVVTEQGEEIKQLKNEK